MKKIIRNGFVAVCVLVLVGILGYGMLASIKNSNSQNQEETILVERDATDDTATTVEEAAAGGPAIPDDPAPDYVGFADIGFHIGNGETQRTVKLYLNGKEGYVFLPSYAKLPKLTAEFDEQIFGLSIDGHDIKNGESFENIRADETYDMAIVVKADNPQVKTYDMYELTFMKSANLPALYIDTADGTMDYLNQDKANEEPGDMLCLTEDGMLDSVGAIRKIHGRGSTSWGNAQKGYTFHTTQATSPLQMKNAKKWCLIANSYDATKLRNPIAYSLAQDLELPYAIDYRYTDVWFNGEYNGNYILCEAIEVQKNRINPSDVDVLMKVDRTAPDSVYFTWDYYGTLEILYPKAPTKSFLEKTRHRINYIFEKIKSCKTKTDFERLEKMIDIDSFAKMYLIYAMTNETDSNYLSTFYYYKEDEGKLYSGPAWDFDLGYGSEQDNRGRYVEYNSYPNGPSEDLIYNPEFANRLREILTEKENAIDNMLTNISAFSEKIHASVLMTRQRFGNQSGGWMVEMGVPEANLYYLQDYTSKRIALMKDTVFHPERYHRILIGNRIYWLKDGNKIPEDFENFVCNVNGWEHFTYVSGLSFLRDQPIKWDMELSGNPIATAPAEPQATEPESADTVTDTATATPETATTTATTTQEKGDPIMTLLGILLLITPGVISLLASGNYQIQKRSDIPTLAAHYLLYEFLTIMLSYGVITLLKGSVTISFAGISRGETYTIFHSNVVFLLSVLFLFVSTAIGVLARLFKQRVVFFGAAIKHLK